jgi:phosphatidylethanolamine/phosphatidyl-N-methylethanolamine N-methyltransferase
MHARERLRRRVARQYDRLAGVYDGIFGSPLQPGRVAALRNMPLTSGDAVLEIGIGTGLTAALYPDDCQVTGIDLSGRMLDRAARRVRAADIRNVRLLEMDAAHLQFPDDSFSAVYAPYVLTTVPDPLAVLREMRRVCRPGGYIVILNHFLSEGRLLSWCERVVSPLTEHLGFRTDLALPALLAHSGLTPLRVEKVNAPRWWSLVICRRRRHSRLTAGPAPDLLLGLVGGLVGALAMGGFSRLVRACAACAMAGSEGNPRQ